MYNRYVRNDAGEYRRIPVEEYGPPPRQEAAHGWAEGGPPPPSFSSPPFSSPPPGGGSQGFLSGLLHKLKLDEIDTGDLLLLLILFLLFKDGEDEELLIALGLLLIL